jgi:Zn-dependent peptidase ImmA (M78 family)
MTVKSEARAQAQKTLDATWADEGYPVDPVTIARKLGIEVFQTDLPDDVSGMLRKEAREAPQIYLDTDDPHVRQRFTCAHEIGHYVRHAAADDGELAFVDWRGPRAARGTDLEEVFANEFAASLLMPARKVQSLFGDGKRELEMSQYFRVSLETAKWRLVNLGLTGV